MENIKGIMTNIEADKSYAKFECHPPFETLVAMHLVSQILDEAYVIANAAKDSGQPWRCLSLLKDFKGSRYDESLEENMFEALKGDSVNENIMEEAANIVATSTPQKLEARHANCSEETVIIVTDLIGQGDEEVDMHLNELTKSPSMLINNLFDMSDVEHIVICDETEVIESTSDNDLLVDVTNEIIDSHVPLQNLVVTVNEDIIENDEIAVVEKVSSTNSSDFSATADAFVTDIVRDVAFYIKDRTQFDHQGYTNRIQELEEIKTDSTEPDVPNEDNNVELFENAYSSLNRDYDQCSDQDSFPVLQDPKEMILQEVELLTANTSEDNLSCHESKQKAEEKIATVSGVSGSRKSTLARRCRLQGARFLACLRGWWRRKTPGKRKETRGPGSIRGVCPLSPESRHRRTSSLGDNRLLRSPLPSHPVVWKFNTVTEAYVNSNSWKEYTFDANPESF